MTKKLLVLFVILQASFAFAQSRSVTGTVTDESGIGLPGVNILETGTQNGVVTDFDGGFAISTDDASTLTISYVGFVTQVIEVKGKTTINVSLAEDLESLDEVVIIGYEAVKKRDLTGAVSSIDTKNALRAPAATVEDVLQGRASGVQVTSSNGQPGSAPVILIRGGNSITAGNDPLYVIDGFVDAGADINSLNPNDIESMQVLKDASATAIYGARGTNGVVLITTKKGKIGKPVLNFKASTGFQTLPDELDVQSSAQLGAWINNNTADQGNLPIDLANLPDTNTNWQRELIRPAVISDYQLSISGGTDLAKYFVSAGYLDQSGIVKGSDFKRYSLRSNIDFNISKTFKTGFNLSLSRVDRNGGTITFTDLVRADPAKPIFDENGEFFNGTSPILGTLSSHILANADDVDNTLLNRVFLNTYIQTNFLDDRLIFKSTFGGDFSFSKRDRFRPSTNPSSLQSGDLSRARINTFNRVSLLNENTVTYNQTFGDHKLNFIGAVTFQTQNQDNFNVDAQQIPSDGVGTSNVALSPAENRITTSSYNEEHFIGLLAKAGYTFKNRYVFNASIRRDGKSSLGENNKWGTFPAASFAWKIKEESFLQNVDAVSDLKLRFGYGKTGNANVDSFSTIPSYGVDRSTIILNGNLQAGVFQESLSNPDLGWEFTEQIDAGLEVSLFNSRLNLEVDVYRKLTTDLLLDEAQASFTGFTTVLRNIGEVENKGIDVTLSGIIIRNPDFQWDASLTVSTNENEVLDLGRGFFISGNRVGAPVNDENSRIIVGQPVGTFWGANYLGFYQEGDDIPAGLSAGDAIFEDISGPNGEPDGVYTPEFDDQIIGDANPDFYGGFQTNVRYKNFDLSAFLTFSVGGEIFNEEFFRVNEPTVNSFAQVRENQYNVVANNTVNALYPTSNDYSYNRSSSLYLQDGSYLRLSTLQLGYSLPTNTISGISKLRLYVTGNNLFLIKDKDYLGFDPDVSSGNADDLERGFDGIAYPKSTSLLFGIDVSF